MSYSMSPPAQKPPPYPPYQQQAASPGAQSPYTAPPPAKRPRLSPDIRSPQNGSPVYGSHGMPGPYGNPYAQQPVQSPYSPGSFAGSPTSAFNTPQPYQQQQMPWPGHPPLQPRNSQLSPPPNSSRDMPPPPRPNKQEERDEKVSNIDDIGDSLFMSGINLKDEENYLHNTYNNRHVSDSFATNQSNSFGSSTVGSSNSFSLTQGTSFGSQGPDGAFAGTLGQPRSQEQVEDEARRQRELQTRRLAEKHQFHLNNQFLQGNCLRNRMHKLGMENAVRLDVTGVYLRNPEPETHVMVNGAVTEGITAVKHSVKEKPESMIEAGVAYEHIISLISLATNERLRGLLDEAYGLARARKYGDHGRVVPPEFSEIAAGQGKRSQETVIPESVTESQWDKTQDSLPAGEIGASANQTNGEKETPQPVQTISFQGSLNAHLRDLAHRDREAENERHKRRDARRRRAENVATDDKTPTDTPAETPAASGPVDAVAPSGKISKKEQNKKQKEAQSAVAQSLNQSNQTAAMMALGGKSRRYAWMGSAAQTPTNRFLKPSGGSGTATPKAQPEPAAAIAAKEKEAKTPTWGDWREDSVDGRGIQLRDWVLVLERDGREKKALQKATDKLQ